MKCILILVVILVVATLPQTEASWRRFTRWLRTPVPYGKKRNVEEREVVEEVTKEEFAATTGLTGAELDLYFKELDENDNGVLDGDEIMEASVLYATLSD